jgi:prepilin-type N-terminal cleavage/methylation domain-containing protein
MLNKFRSKAQQGFTLVELMIVVAIIGILAVVAIPTYMRFTRQSKTSEVVTNLGAMVKGATGWYNDEHTDTATGNPVVRHFPTNDLTLAVVNPQGTTALNAAVPWANAAPGDQDATATAPFDTVPCQTGQSLYNRNGQFWEARVWQRLNFGIDKAHYYQYYYASSGTGRESNFLVAGRADLDCDQTYSDYRVRGEVNPGSGEVQVTNMIKKDPLE